MGGTGILNCLDGHTCDVIWTVDAIEAGDKPLNFGVSSSPLVVDDIVVSAGYGRGTTRFRLHDDGGEWDVEKLWHSSKLGTKFSSVMVHEGHIYGLNDGILTCVRLTDGQRQWKRGRYVTGRSS